MSSVHVWRARVRPTDPASGLEPYWIVAHGLKWLNKELDRTCGERDMYVESIDRVTLIGTMGQIGVTACTVLDFDAVIEPDMATKVIEPRHVPHKWRKP